MNTEISNGNELMREYQKPEIEVVILEPNEPIANTIPTVTDEEYDELSIPNDFGDGYWD